jgi:hypothetical protein
MKEEGLLRPVSNDDQQDTIFAGLHYVVACESSSARAYVNLQRV